MNKFRILNKATNQYCDPIIYESTLNDFLADDRYIFQRFTGANDKNGVEIYEGDILLVNTFIGLVHIDVTHGLRTMFAEDRMSQADAAHGEVIGNIHHNPELLT